MSKGWVKIHRSIWDCWLWQHKPFSRGQAWIDLILMANHKDKKVFIDGKPVNVNRGQLITSIRKLSDRWGWSRVKVTLFLDALTGDEKVFVNSDKKKTLITLINYSVYQDEEATEKPQKSH